MNLGYPNQLSPVTLIFPTFISIAPTEATLVKEATDYYINKFYDFDVSKHEYLNANSADIESQMTVISKTNRKTSVIININDRDAAFEEACNSKDPDLLEEGKKLWTSTKRSLRNAKRDYIN